MLPVYVYIYDLSLIFPGGIPFLFYSCIEDNCVCVWTSNGEIFIGQ